MIRAEKKKTEKKKYFLYANKEILPVLFKSTPLISDELEDYYIYSEFFPIPRTNYIANINFPENFTALIKLFKQFFPREHIEIMIISINKYTQQILKKREISEMKRAPSYSRKYNWWHRMRHLTFKLFIIQEVYKFLTI
jgi:hypothetical protein